MTLPQKLLFDWDNTLVESWQRIHYGWQQTLQEYNLPPRTLEDIKGTVRQSARDSFTGVFGAEHASEAIQRYRHHYGQYPHPVQPLENAEKLLKICILKNISCGVVSNKSHDFLQSEIVETGWGKYFTLGRLGAGAAKVDKPHPDTLAHLLPNPNDWQGLWYVGDTGIDIQFAINCGIPSVLIGENVTSDEPMPTHQFDDLFEFKSFIEFHG